MFTTDQINEARSKVKSGADFPRLVQDFIKIGIRKYDHMVNDDSTIYFGAQDFRLRLEGKQNQKEINKNSSADQLKQALKIHQAGGTDYPAFCQQAADAGVEKWVSDLKEMTVSYLDLSGKSLLVEKIPS